MAINIENNEEMTKLKRLIDKYKNLVNSSYLKYNFLIEFHNTFIGIYKLDFSLKDKKNKNVKYPLKTYIPPSKQIKKPYFLTSNILYFLISEEFNSDMELLLIKKMDNESSIFNGLIINMDKYEIVCYPIKNRLISKNCNIKKFNDDEVLYEYDIYKLYDGINISLYYYNKTWNISGFNKININDICYDKSNTKLKDKLNDIILKNIILGKIYINIDNYILNVNKYKNLLEDYDDINDNIFDKIKEELNIESILNKFYNNLDKKYTYNMVLINKNYNLCSKKDKIKFVNKTNSVENEYNDNTFEEISMKRITHLKQIQKNGLVLISKHNNEDRIIYYNNYYNLNKLLYAHIKKNIFDINMIILRNIIIYKVSKIVLNEVFYKYNNVYNNIVKKIDVLINYLYEYIVKLNFPKSDLLKNELELEYNTKIKQNFIEVIIRFIKKNKYLNDILFLNSENEVDILNFKELYFHNKDLYKSMIKDYILNKEIINDLYLYIFS